MSGIFVIILLGSIVVGIVGLINPARIKLPSRKRVLMVCGITFIVGFFGVAATAPPAPPKPATVAATNQNQLTTSIPAAAPENKPDVQQAVAEVPPQPKPSFDIPSLFGKNITQIRAALGGKPKDAATPSKSELQAANYEWDETYQNGDISLDVTYDYKTLAVKNFFITSTDAVADKSVLGIAGNFNIAGADYRVKFVPEINDASKFTGAFIISPQALQATISQRQKFDTNLGNNSMAAQTATTFITLYKSVGFDGAVNLQAPDDAEKDYAAGGDESDYRGKVTAATLAADVTNISWAYATDTTKKDFVTSLVKSLKQNYPNSSVQVNISNGIRTVATGRWSDWDGTSVELQ